MKPIKIALCSTAVIAALSAQAEIGFRFQPYVGLDYQYILLNYKEDFKINQELVGNTRGNVNGLWVSDILPTQLKGGVIYFGTPLTTHFGIEAGFAQSVNAKKNIATKVSSKIIKRQSVDYCDIYTINGTGHLKMRSMYLDVLGYLPLDPANRFELIGSIGVARVKTQAKVSGEVEYQEWDHATIEKSKKDVRLKGIKTQEGLGSGDLLDTNKSETDIRLGFGAQYQVVKNLNARAMVRYQDLDLDDLGKGTYQFNLGLNYSF